MNALILDKEAYKFITDFLPDNTIWVCNKEMDGTFIINFNSDESVIMFKEKIVDYIQVHGIVSDELNKVGIICEKIIDQIYDQLDM